jgi:hypothetical protein
VARRRRRLGSCRAAGWAHKEIKISIFEGIPHSRMGRGGGGEPFDSRSLAQVKVRRDVSIYVHILTQKVNIYLPFSTQKGCNPFSFLMVLEDMCSAFEGFF